VVTGATDGIGKAYAEAVSIALHQLTPPVDKETFRPVAYVTHSALALLLEAAITM
jgi:NAD(P)-dependent dehydrogenase (short-subunit alcohol dehydrogenase family)